MAEAKCACGHELALHMYGRCWKTYVGRRMCPCKQKT